MGAISARSSELFFIAQHSHFNHRDFIKLCKKLMSYHKRKQVVVFVDNASIHTCKDAMRFVNSQPRLHLVENLKYDPEKNGIETLWHSAKMKFRKALTEEKIKDKVDFNTKQMVIDILEGSTQ